MQQSLTTEPNPTIAQQVARAVREFQEQRTGHAPKGVTVVLSEGTVVVTLQEALTPAELALARTPEGASQVRTFHRELFQSSVSVLKAEIERITGVAVREAAAEVELATGAVVHVFTSGSMVQVFQLAGELSAETWNSTAAPPRDGRNPSADGSRTASPPADADA